MIKYTPQSQLTLEGFEHPFDNELDKNNRWVVLANLIPWDDFASVYSRNLKSDKGRLSVDLRMVIGALIIKHKLKLSDRETVSTISENIYIQYFCGLKSFQKREPFDASLFVDIRKRMGTKEFDQFNNLVIQRYEQIKSGKKSPKTTQKVDTKEHNQPGEVNADNQIDKVTVTQEPVPNKGTLKIDATVADQMITYPTDLNLINTSREESERLIDILYPESGLSEKPRTYRRLARAAYLSLAKQKNKDKRKLRKAIGKQLRFLNRNLKTIEAMLDRFNGRKFPLKYRDLRIYWVIQHIYQQQFMMYQDRKHSCPNRIVNIYQPYVRPIVRGKDKAKVEFGAKINVSEYNGMSKIDHFDWEAYNESVDLKLQAERYRTLFGYYPELLLADQIYLNRANRAWLKEKGIRIVGKALGRPSKIPESAYRKYKTRKERNQRNLIEGKFGQGKNGYALNCIRARRSDTSKSWINAIFLVMNLITLSKVAGKAFLGSLLNLLSCVKKVIHAIMSLLHFPDNYFQPTQRKYMYGLLKWIPQI